MVWRGVVVLIVGNDMAWHGVAYTRAWRGMAKRGVFYTSGGVYEAASYSTACSVTVAVSCVILLDYAVIVQSVQLRWR